MAKVKAMQVSKAGGPLEMVEREAERPAAGWVRVRVEACGVCHSDSLVKEGLMPVAYPRVPGHEVVGLIEEVGEGVEGWLVGERVGVGWHGGYCGRCENCRRGYFFACEWNKVTGLTHDGGYGETMTAPATSLARVPKELTAEEAAPLMCAGVTTFNCLRNAGARPGETVAILGMGGLGHLGVQFAAKMGFRTVGIARGADKGELAAKLGAAAYIDSTVEDPGAALRKMGGASVILSTVTNGAAMEAAMGGLGLDGRFMLIGAVPSLSVPVFQFLMGRQAARGWYSGTSIDSEDTLKFCALTGVRSWNEVYPMAKGAEAYERMMSGEARFRVVMRMG